MARRDKNITSTRRKIVPDWFSMIRVGFWQNGFLCSCCQIFLRILSPGFFFPHFCGKCAQKNPPGKAAAKSSKICTTKIPDTFSAEGPGQQLPSLCPTSSRFAIQSRAIPLQCDTPKTSEKMQSSLPCRGPWLQFGLYQARKTNPNLNF